MTLGCFKNNFDVHEVENNFEVLSSTSSLVQSGFIVFSYEFEQAKHIQ